MLHKRGVRVCGNNWYMQFGDVWDDDWLVFCFCFPELLFVSIEILPQEVLQKNHLPMVFAFVCSCKSNIDRLCLKLILFSDRNTCSSGTWGLILIRKGFHETQRTPLYSSGLSSYYPLKRMICYLSFEELQLDIQMELWCDCYWFLSI